MKSISRAFASVVVAAPVLVFAQAAFAQAEPCGKFDFFVEGEAISCKIEVEGGCAANCTPLKLEAGCYGKCTATASTSCTASCSEQCIAQCDPGKLDCFVGCHDECDEPMKQECMNRNNPGDDCVSIAVAQCDIHCKDSCKVEPTTCDEHCNTCCSGGCQTITNYDCDYNCMVDLQGGCEVQCEEPSGALFCNGQYIGADDIEACIAYLEEQNITVDVSARGTVECDLSGCKGTGSAGVGLCSTANVGTPAAGAFGFGVALSGLAAALLGRRRKDRK